MEKGTRSIYKLSVTQFVKIININTSGFYVANYFGNIFLYV